jgi:hypothetical protein
MIEVVPRTFWALAKLKPVRSRWAVFRFGYAPGDDLLLTGIIDYWHRKTGRKAIVLTNHEELFLHHPGVARCLPYDEKWDHRLKLVPFQWPLWYARVASDGDTWEKPDKHILLRILEQMRMPLPDAPPAPRLFLTESERRAYSTYKDCLAFQSSGLGKRVPMMNKEWSYRRMLEVVNRLKGKVRTLQVGLASDPPLPVELDLRDRLSFRDTGAVLSLCRGFVGQVGALMHLARAVDCPSVIIYGGREAPWQSGYPENENLYTPVHCAPCWKANHCDFDRLCMYRIGVEDLIQASSRRFGLTSGE